MEDAYSLLLPLIAGAVLGLYVSARAVAALGAALIAVTLTALVLSGLSGNETLTWTFGIAGVVTPPLMFLVWLGALMAVGMRRLVEKTVHG